MNYMSHVRVRQIRNELDTITNRFIPLKLKFMAKRIKEEFERDIKKYEKCNDARIMGVIYSYDTKISMMYDRYGPNSVDGCRKQ